MEITQINPKRFENQKGIIDPAILANQQFTVIGAGAIGSILVPMLAKMGAQKILVYDDDKIEEHNVANQYYPEADIGEYKVDSLERVVRAQSGVQIEYARQRWEPGGRFGGYIISAVDNMDTRRKLWVDAISNPGAPIFVDGRMGAQFMRVYCIRTGDEGQRAYYEKTLYSDSQAEPERCTEKSIMDTGLVLAGYMLAMIRQELTGKWHPKGRAYDTITWHGEND